METLGPFRHAFHQHQYESNAHCANQGFYNYTAFQQCVPDLPTFSNDSLLAIRAVIGSKPADLPGYKEVLFDFASPRKPTTLVLDCPLTSCTPWWYPVDVFPRTLIVLAVTKENNM